jgi:hypothetical protein
MIKVIIMSAAAHQSLTPKPLNGLRERTHGSTSSSLDTIEACGVVKDA